MAGVEKISGPIETRLQALGVGTSPQAAYSGGLDHQKEVWVRPAGMSMKKLNMQQLLKFK